LTYTYKCDKIEAISKNKYSLTQIIMNTKGKKLYEFLRSYDNSFINFFSIFEKSIIVDFCNDTKNNSKDFNESLYKEFLDYLNMKLFK